ncbi:MAG TPA: hypothetical protein VF174_08720 [Micromonosporaceae bacterium]
MPPPPYGAPPPPGKGGGNGLKLALIIGGVVLLVLLICCGVGIVVLLNMDTDLNTSPTVNQPSAVTSETPQADDEATDDPGAFAKGDCVVNDGTDDDATLRKVPCGPDTYEVLTVIPFTTDDSRCDDPVFGDPETDTTFTYDSTMSIEDYVLCMKSR